MKKLNFALAISILLMLYSLAGHSQNIENPMVKLEKGVYMFSGRQAMVIPTDSALRSVNIAVNALFKQNPVVNLTIWSPDTPGNMFTVYNLKFNYDQTKTYVGVETGNVTIGQHVPYLYYCDYIIIGVIKKHNNYSTQLYSKK